jgi:hypothetical protein
VCRTLDRLRMSMASMDLLGLGSIRGVDSIGLSILFMHM